MLTPSYLAKVSNRLVEIYAQLETDIIADMAYSIKKLGDTSAVDWSAKMYIESGLVKERALKLLDKYEPKVQAEIKRAFDEAITKSVKADNAVFTAAGLAPTEATKQRVMAEIEKTAYTLRNLTLTTASTSQQEFINKATQAYMRVSSGAFDYDRSMMLAVDDLARAGVYTVEYTGSGKVIRRSIESAVRANILTGINQTATAVTNDNIVRLGVNFVETSAHSGARPSHAEWQGRIFQLVGNDQYPNFYEVCKPGTAEGIGGVNCKHSYKAYLGGEPDYTPEALEKLEEKTMTFNGKKYTEYEAEQVQRKLERNIRYYKRQIVGRETLGADVGEKRELLQKWRGEMQSFVKQTGLRRDYPREYIGT